MHLSMRTPAAKLFEPVPAELVFDGLPLAGLVPGAAETNPAPPPEPPKIGTEWA